MKRLIFSVLALCSLSIWGADAQYVPTAPPGAAGVGVEGAAGASATGRAGSAGTASAANPGGPGWQNLSFEDDGVYGAGISKAREAVKGLKPKKKVTVALIGTGVDIENQDLTGTIWLNSREKANGRDDDKNGYADDLHGWNFLGNADGEVVDALASGADREFLRLREKYGKYYHGGGDVFYVLDKEKNEMVRVDPPANMKEFRYFRYYISLHTPLASAYNGAMAKESARWYVDNGTKKLRATYPGRELTENDLSTLIKADARTSDSMLIHAITFAGLGKSVLNMRPRRDESGEKITESWDYLTDFIKKGNAFGLYEKHLAGTVVDDRNMVGDNPLDIADRTYGNNTLITENAGMGTLLAGVIGARGGAAPGVAEGLVNLMPLRIEAGEGEWYMKDLALAIRYAVDKGAEVIQLPAPVMFLPQDQTQWVEDALLYAGQKGVLLVMPVREEATDLDRTPSFPASKLLSDKMLDNLVTVAPSDVNGSPALDSDYGRQSVDLFAPGEKIHSTYMGDTYRTASDPRLAAAMVTGVAALLKAYYPELQPAQLRRILVESVTSRDGAEVEKHLYAYRADGSRDPSLYKDVMDFGDLSASAGILNALRAVEMAARTRK